MKPHTLTSKSTSHHTPLAVILRPFGFSSFLLIAKLLSSSPLKTAWKFGIPGQANPPHQQILTFSKNILNISN
jgi:hypothetical protein